LGRTRQRERRGSTGRAGQSKAEKRLAIRLCIDGLLLCHGFGHFRHQQQSDRDTILNIGSQAEDVNPSVQWCSSTIATEADPVMAKLHNRMPVILAKALEAAWLDPELTQAQDVLDVLSRSTGLELHTYPVSRMMNKPSVDSPVSIQRVG
jgi:putative SOS response-associated peptidase YedK